VIDDRDHAVTRGLCRRPAIGVLLAGRASYRHDFPALNVRDFRYARRAETHENPPRRKSDAQASWEFQVVSLALFSGGRSRAPRYV
jgi:hypothetical protein